MASVNADAERVVDDTVWGAAPYERIEATLADVHGRMLERFRGTGRRWLDVACGTGSLALAAAATGAAAAGLDLSPSLIAKARRAASERQVVAEFHVGNCEAMPFEDGSFEVVTSTFGTMFAADHGRVAGEIARVLAPGGELGLASWDPDGEVGRMFALLGEFAPSPPGGNPLDWGRPEHVSDLLGDHLDLEFERGVSLLRAGSGGSVWEEFATSFGPMKSLLDSLAPERRRELETRFVAMVEESRGADGIAWPRAYLLTTGVRRSASPDHA